MDVLEKLKREWKKNMISEAKTQQELWNSEASAYAEQPLPSFDNNSFLKQIQEEIGLNRQLRVLDVGCGAGAYSLVLAPYVKEIVGVDISSKMIEYANYKKKELKYNNVSFQCINWAEADIDMLDFRAGFDLVFAHMTPAVSDYETLEKLNACARKFCILKKPTRREDFIQDECFRQIGVEQKKRYDSDIVSAFSYLWYQGYCPGIQYEDDVWKMERSVENMEAWCINRIKIQQKITKQQEEIVRKYLKEKAIDGVVYETITTTLVTMLWKTDKRRK